MAQPSREGRQPGTQGAEKRAYTRHPLRVAAVCTSPQDPAIRRPCHIRDFCVGGMFVVYDPAGGSGFLPTVGETVRIDCTPETPTGTDPLHFLGRIVRTDGGSAGITLSNPDRNALRALAEIARAQAAESRRATPPGHAPGTPERRATGDLLAACRGQALEQSRDIVQAVLDETANQLFEAAEHAPSTQEQNVLFDALGVVNRSKPGMIQRYQEELGHRMEQLPARDTPAEHPTDDALSLVEEDVLEDWLAISDVANHIESRNHMVLGGLERQLAQLPHHPVDKENNPFAPAVFAQALQEALKPLSLEHKVVQLCYNAARSVMAERLGNLYNGLSRFLGEHGIDAGIKKPAPRPRARDKAKRKIPAAGAEPRAPSPDAPPAEPGAPAPPPAAEGHDAAPASAGTSGPGAAGDPTAPPDLYELVRDLRDLQRQYGGGQGTAGGSSGESSVAAADPAHGTFSPQELVSALSRLQDAGPAGTPGDAGLKDRVESALAATAQGDEAGKHIGTRESGIMDVAGNLFDSMLHDMLVAHSVRSWLQRLEIPLAKLAIQDDSLFIDKSHVARQVINKIARLELYGDQDHKGESALHRKVDQLVDRITNEVDTDPEIFNKALKEIDGLVRIQDEAYSENLKDVVKSCEAEQDGAAAHPPPPAPPSLSNDEWQEWLRRARRLKVGSWVLFAGDPERPQRLCLAWVSRHKDRFVFVNLRGLREATMPLEDLAAGLKEGTTIVLDNADEPVMDRAQYNMLQNLHHQLLHETTHDQLTGLNNRREFERRLRESLDSAQHLGLRHSLLYMDVDQFSVINTTCGYSAGDQMLTELTELLKKVMGNRAILARMGSDEFGILLEHCTAEEALEIAEQQMSAMRNYRFEWQDKRFTVSFGLGLVEMDGTNTNAAELLQSAESACRSAKERGSNHIQLYKSDDAKLSRRQDIMHWVARIDKALDEGTLDLRCQRITAITDRGAGAPHHAEILLDVTDDAGNSISPQEFIIAAEHYHRMPAIDRWVIQTVFEWMAAHTGILERIGGFAINLSGRSLSDESLMAFILEQAERTGAPMDRVCFEVTETAGIDNLTDATEFILEMKKSGCHFSLDDFGSGLSSYAYLKNLPVDHLKIDGAFVKEMDKNDSDYAVVKSITEIGHFMGKRIIAEYVENETIFNLLREIGVDYAQGYVIEKPRRLHDLGT